MGVNQIELEYTYGRANASIDTSLIVEGATLNLNQGTVRYTRHFSLFHRTAWALDLFRLGELRCTRATAIPQTCRFWQFPAWGGQPTLLVRCLLFNIFCGISLEGE
jgi:hypothetical protein